MPELGSRTPHQETRQENHARKDHRGGNGENDGEFNARRLCKDVS